MHTLTIGTYCSGGIDGCSYAAQQLNEAAQQQLFEAKWHCENDQQTGTICALIRFADKIGHVEPQG